MPPSKSHAAAGSLVLSIASCVVYSVMSNVMVLTNRYLLGKKYYGFEEKFFVVAVQAAVAVLVLELAKMQKLISYDPYDAKVARQWAPVTFFFVAMLYTGMQATAGLPIHIVTVFKNVTNIIIVVGEWRVFGERVGGLVIVSLGVMLMGAVMSSYSDVGGKATPSTLSGYFWMFLNCASTAAYVLYMRYATSRSSLKISKFGMAFYNNLISLPLLAPPLVLNGEAFTVWSNPLLGNFNFTMLLFISGVLGVGLNLASFWCVSVTSATTYATVGGLNKIPTTFIGVLLLGEPLKPDTAIYVTFGMIGGILYGYAKFREGEAAKKRKAAAQDALPQTTHDSKA
ncbi:GDP-mannose transporter [Phytophthora cinnamomi]|uniref:GDP-mannose transporter n=1 Tax=Phytophthora cinnamomi TaxID=4785 RepID=UPI00355AB3DE|nr:GDP-mannose transporter [Phytophthora cinnamomi]